jgi:5-methylcytosine-specific restriction endonuclease McrA
MNNGNTIKIPTDPAVIQEIIRQYHVKNGLKAGETNKKKGSEYFKRINHLAQMAHWGNHTKPTPEQNKLILKRNKMNSDSSKFGDGSIIEVEDLKQILADNDYQCSNCSTKNLIGFSRITSYKNGGRNVKENYIILCRSCNSKRMHQKN